MKNLVKKNNKKSSQCKLLISDCPHFPLAYEGRDRQRQNRDRYYLKKRLISEIPNMKDRYLELHSFFRATLADP